ncbi:hypothetical protein GGR54DRAFT_654697 [Hypoxylon sp. NC1633]|nr:hypothetical protein GGR54DRAFT_654697 [Hypoxylon sp. NC1633]
MSAFTSSTTKSVSTAPTSTLSESNHEDPMISFTSTQNLFEAIDCIAGDAFLVTGVSITSFAEIEEQRVARRRKIRWRRYDAKTQLLLITVPTGVHEILHTQLYGEFIEQLPASGVPRRAWLHKAATYFHSNHPGGGGGGEADSSGGPKTHRLRSRDWPTLVIEAGVSESLNQLHAGMRWWFAASNHDVKIVVLTKFNQQQSKIIIEKWEEVQAARPGATTRRAATLQPVLLQTIEITRDLTTNPVSYNVTSGALVLEFSLLFLRNPGPLERDVVIGTQFLQEYAELVWLQNA